MHDTKIKINGYQLREGIKRWLLQRDAAAQAFKDSVFTFVGEEKDGPLKVMAIWVLNSVRLSLASNNFLRQKHYNSCLHLLEMMLT